MTAMLAFVANTSWNLVNFRFPVIRRLRDQGFTVYAVAPADEYSSELEAEGMEFMPLMSMVRESRNPFKELRVLAEMAWIYARMPVGVFLQFTPKVNVYGSLAAALTGKACISTVSGLGYAFTGRRLLGSLLKLLYKLAFSFNRKVVFQNRDDQRFFVVEGLVSEPKTVVVPGSGVDTRRFSPLPSSTQRGDQVVFLLVSRLLWDKGIKEFVEAAGVVKRRFSNTRFWLLGPVDDGNPAAIPRSVVEGWERDGIVEWLGPVDDVLPVLRKVQVVVLPSYREGMPRSLLEALSVGKLLLTTDTVGCRETVEDGVNGLLVEPRDAGALAGAMTRLALVSERGRRVMGLRSRERALREFSVDTVVDEYLGLIKELDS